MDGHLISQVSSVDALTSYPCIVSEDTHQAHDTAYHTFPSSHHSSGTCVFLGISADREEGVRIAI